jgi:putative membrane-bound dehydrogenase-like protein
MSQFFRFTLVSLCFTAFFSSKLVRTCHADWKTVKIPETWKSPPPAQGGYSWYRCLVRVPAMWQSRSLEIFVEPVDDAREFYMNGELVGSVGAFPPQFRSGLGMPDRHKVATEHVKFGELNVIAIRVYDSDGRGGFNVAAPVLFGGDQAIRLDGNWQFQSGDNREWGKWSATTPPAEELVFSKLQPKSEAERILRRLPGEEGPLTAVEALTRLKVPDNLKVELVLSEPEIGQPLFLSFDERGRLWVMNYLQYPNPAGLTMVSRDKFLRSVYDKTPAPPPHHIRGADKITIHEDTDGDGRFDSHKTFVDGLNLATSFARGRGGVWVLNPPYLLFYPDENQDDVPDRDPTVHLEGFGLEDSHSIASNLKFGPDGWLYAAQGSTVTGNIKHFGTKEKPAFSMGQLIWRYHPESRRYEIFAEGGGNTFGVEIDSKGRLYSGHNGGDTRGFHYVQGGYYQKGFGKHGELSNPYAFGYFPHMSHHSVPRFTHTFIIYEGAALSAEYEGKIFGVGPLQGHVVMSDVQPAGPTFKTRDIGYALTSKDPWCRPVHLTSGPDGAIYVADFYEQRIDHASHYQGRVDKSTGRVYRLSAKDSRQVTPRFNYAKASTEDLIEALRSENRWHRQSAQQVLADRKDQSLVANLVSLVEKERGQMALEAFWALNASGGLSDTITLRTLQHPDPFVRLWSVRLAADDHSVSATLAGAMAELALKEPNIEVRCQLACSARRLPADQCLSIVKNLLTRDEDAGDAFLPLLSWWAIEAKSTSDRDAVVALFRNRDLWDQPIVKQHILERSMRRFAQAGGQKDLLACAQLLELAPSKDHITSLMTGFETAFSGRELAGLPSELTAAIAKAGGGSLALRLRSGDPKAVSEALQVVADDKADRPTRIRFLQVLGQVQQPSCVPVLLKVAANAQDDDVRSAAISSLQAYDDAAIPDQLIQTSGKLSAAVREVALSVLASRRTWASKLVAAVVAGTIPPDQVPRGVVQRMLFLRDPELAAQVKQHWGNVQDASTEEMRQLVERFTEVIAAGSGNPYKGKRLFDQNCGKCHVLFNAGGKIGPDLTSYKRDDLRGILMNVINPSLEIREGFENFVVITSDGRTLNGFVTEQDNRVVVLKQADGQSVLIPRDDIEEMSAIRRSIMPEALLKEYNDQQVRDLFAYLRSTQPLPE